MGEIKENVLVFLCLILVILSFISTYLIFSYINTIPTTTPNQGSGIVSLTVLPQEEKGQPSTTGGVVSINIKPLS